MVSFADNFTLITEVKVQSDPGGINGKLFCCAKLLVQFRSYSLNIMNKFNQIMRGILELLVGYVL